MTLAARSTWNYGCDCPDFSIDGLLEAFFWAAFSNKILNAHEYSGQFGSFVLHGRFTGRTLTRKEFLRAPAAARPTEGDEYWSSNPQPEFDVESWCYYQGGELRSAFREVVKQMWADGVSWCELPAQKLPTLAGPTHLGTADMALIAAGDIVMGSATLRDDERENWDELAGAATHLDAFRIDRTEVTVAAFAACVGAGACPAPSHPHPGTYVFGECNWGKAARASHPINCISFDEAARYCEWVGKRLPSEAEWEFAARGPKARLFPWGNLEPPYGESICAEDTTCEVGKFATGVSPEGVHDLIGNVWEWTSSAYCCKKGDCKESHARVLRGGGYQDLTPTPTGTTRHFALRAYRSPTVGLRCASGG